MLPKNSILRRRGAGVSLPACLDVTPVHEDETLIRRVPNNLFFCICALLLIMPAIAFGQIFSNVTVGGSTISPDGDGIQDSTYIEVTFSDSVYSFDVFILTGDTLNIVDFLVDGEARGAGTDTTWWIGRNFFGTVVPEGDYLFFVRAQNASGADSVYKAIHVDLTAPQVAITQIQPGTLIAPGLLDQQPLRIDYIVSDVFPTDSTDVTVRVMRPAGDTLVTLTKKRLQIDKTYRTEWDGSDALADGIHDIQIRATDNGGHLAVAFTPINVDLDLPEIEITSPDNDTKFNVVPDSIEGWVYDRNGVTPLLIAYSDKRLYAPVPNQWMMNDTLFFNAPLADSVTEEREYQLFFKVSDKAGRTDSVNFSIELDTSSPDPPVLNPPGEVVHVPKYTLTGSFSADTKKIRIFRNGAYVDSVFIVIQTSLEEEVLLTPDDNIFTAIALDEAGNTSAPSNAVTVVYDAATSVYIPQPFGPNDSFQINLGGEEARITLKIFDLGGDLVYAHRDYTPGSNIEIQWDGLNGEGEEVKRGPLVLVVRVAFDNGNENTFRELFLFKR
jgi:hypothetical protein